MKLSIVIPAYNEERTIEQVLDAVRTIDRARDFLEAARDELGARE